MNHGKFLHIYNDCNIVFLWKYYFILGIFSLTQLFHSSFSEFLRPVFKCIKQGPHNLISSFFFPVSFYCPFLVHLFIYHMCACVALTQTCMQQLACEGQRTTFGSQFCTPGLGGSDPARILRCGRGPSSLVLYSLERHGHWTASISCLVLVFLHRKASSVTEL